MTIKKILQGRILGHPLHPLLTHLPLGLWLLALILDFLSVTESGNDWALHGAAWCLVIGTAAAALAAITGFADWLDIRADHPAQSAALWHMAMMFPAICLFAIDTMLHIAHHHRTEATGVMLAISITGYALTIVGGYLGGVLVYDDGIAVGRHRRRTELPQNTIHEPRKETTEVGLAPGVGLPANFHPLIPEAVLREGGTLRVELQGVLITLARAGDQVYAVQEFCTHRCGPLSEGTVEDNAIRCPWHNSRFDLTTGKVIHGPAKVDLKTFPVRVHEGIVHVALDAPATAPAPIAAPSAATTPTEVSLSEGRGSDRRNPQEAPDPERKQEREKPLRRTPRE